MRVLSLIFLQTSKCATYVKEALEKKTLYGKAASYEECLTVMDGEEVIPECISFDADKVDGLVSCQW